MTRVLLGLLPFVILLALFLLVAPFLKRMLQRDRESPPTPKAQAMRTMPFLGVAAAGLLWSVVREDWIWATWLAVSMLAFVVAIALYVRHWRD